MKLLREGGKTLASAMIWTKNQATVINTHLTLFDDSEKILKAWVPTGTDPASLIFALKASGSNDCFFSVSLSRANIFFRAPMKGVEEDTSSVVFGLPDKVFKVQRRKDMRFPIPDGWVLKIKFQDPLFSERTVERKVLDISASGLAFIVTDADAAMYQVGMVLKDLTFTVRARTIVAEAEIRHTQTLPSGSKNPGVKIGILFKNLKPADSNHIAQYVFEESRKFYSRFI
ncbi:MAG: flagellar brake protein [Bdellovibrionota bacterium]